MEVIVLPDYEMCRAKGSLEIILNIMSVIPVINPRSLVGLCEDI